MGLLALIQYQSAALIGCLCCCRHDSALPLRLLRHQNRWNINGTACTPRSRDAPWYFQKLSSILWALMMTEERERESKGADLWVERAIKWLEAVLHPVANEADKKTLKPVGYFPSFRLKLTCLSRPFGAIEGFKEHNKKWEMVCYLCMNLS